MKIQRSSSQARGTKGEVDDFDLSNLLRREPNQAKIAHG
jgi:hypothetical protein